MKLNTVPIVATALCASGVVILTIVTIVAPVIGLGLLSIVLFVGWAIYKPLPAACAIAFLAAAFPKAGVKIAGFPFPVFLFGLLLAVALVAIATRRVELSVITHVIVGAYLTIVLVRSMVIAESGVAGVFAFVAWAILPMVVLLLMVPVSSDAVKFRRAFEYGFLVSVAYAVAQLAFGIERIAIPGLTHAFGDDIANKHNVIFSDSGADFSKIPSTYQNGNIYGLVAAFFFAAALRRIVARQASRLDWFVAIGAILAIAVSGSRTAIVAAGITALIIFLQRGSVGRKLAIVVVVLGALATVIALQPGLVERYSIDSITESGGAGRASQWTARLAPLTPAEILFGTSERILAEGWVGFILQIGLVGIVFLIFATVILLRVKSGWFVPFLVLAIGALVDSSYQLFPTWFIPAAMTAAGALSTDRTQALEGAQKRTRASRFVSPGLDPRRYTRSCAAESKAPTV